MKLSSLLCLIAASSALAAGAPAENNQDMVFPESALKQVIEIPEGTIPVLATENDKPVVLVIESAALEGNDKRDLEKRGRKWKWQGKFMFTRYRPFQPL